MRSQRNHAFLSEEDAAHFITTVTHERAPIFLDTWAAKYLMEEIHFYGKQQNTDVVAYVIMPDHIHLIIYPQGKKTAIDFMHGIKGYFAKWYGEELVRRGMVAPPMNGKKYMPKIWQDSYFDWLITSEARLTEKISYIMQNPVEDGLVARAEDYQYLYVNPEYSIY